MESFNQKQFARDMGFVSSNKLNKKRRSLTSKQRIYVWEHPNMYGKTCSICHKRITKLSDLELDHTRAFSKGGKKLALAHRDCNRMKGSGSLRKIQKTLGFRTITKRTRKRTKKKRKRTSDSGFFSTQGTMFDTTKKNRRSFF